MQKQNTHVKSLSFWREYWYVGLGIFGFLILIIAQIFRILTPAPVPIQQNSWGEITPGYSTLDQITEKLGSPLSTEDTEQGLAVYYQSEFLTFPDTLVVDNSNTVQFIKEFIPYDPNHNLQQYIEQFGQADLKLYEGYSGEAHVFLSQGVVIIAHIPDGNVEQKWYFSPTTEERFLQTWGQRLDREAEGPEEFKEF